MASAVVTRNKKSIFPSMGTRNRLPVAQGRAVDYLECIVPPSPLLRLCGIEAYVLEHAVAGMSPRGKELTKTPHAIPLSHKDSVEEMASALLDSAMEDQLLSTPISGKVRRPLHNDHPISILTIPSQILWGPAPASGESLSSSREAVRRRLPKSHTCLNPLAQNPHKLPASATLNLTTQRLPDTRHQLDPYHAQTAELDDVDRQLEEMLAAAGAVSPVTKKNHRQSVGGGLPSVIHRLKTAKVFSKVSSAFRHRSLGAHLKMKSGVRGNNPGAAESAGQPLDVWALAPPTLAEDLTPVHSMELRLNEGCNLNRKKVRQITGGHVSRKPVPVEHEALPASQPHDDPFSESGVVSRTPTPFECRLRDSHRSFESYVFPLLRTDPFVTEKIFEGSADSILYSPPLASSTPRTRSSHIRSTSDTPPKKSSRMLSSLADPWLKRPNSTSSLEGKRCERILSEFSLGSPREDSGGVTRSLSKKHPSPSKAQLECFSKKLDSYPDLHVHPVHLQMSPEVRIKKHQSPTKHQMKTLSRHLALQKLSTACEDTETNIDHTHIDPFFPMGRGLTSYSQRTRVPSRTPGEDTPAILSLTTKERTRLASEVSPVSEKGQIESLIFSPSMYKHSPRASKKHPTPSLQDLEFLDRQLRRYQITGYVGPEEIDELADPFYDRVPHSATANVLGHRDTHRGVSPRYSSHAAAAEAKPRQRSLFSKTRTYSQLPLRSEGMTRSRTDVRLATRFHPSHGNAGDLDELRWDSSPYRLGGHIAEVY